jgi:hypothetical protein
MTFEYYSVSGLFVSPSVVLLHSILLRLYHFLLFLNPPICLPLRVIRRPALVPLVFSEQPAIETHAFDAPLCIPSASTPRLMGLT